jgi:hypothetical protein
LSYGTEHPTHIFTDLETWELIGACLESKQQGSANLTEKMKNDPILSQYNTLNFYGIPIVCDDMRVNDVSISKTGVIDFLNLNHITMYEHTGDSFRQSGWEESKQQWFVETNDISHIMTIAYKTRNRNGRLTLPTGFDYNA